MDSKQGKSIATSVPSISVKFHADGEQLEEIYNSEDEITSLSKVNEKTPLPTSITASNLSSSGGNIEAEGSPLKFFRLSKKSSSIDTSSQGALDASPPSDTWKFFSDIKGKITKSVEDKLTEIKARSHDEGSPLKGKLDKQSKENSFSDSEDLSESSISKTCGVSTTEGAEMSSDEDTPSLEKDKKPEGIKLPLAQTKLGLRQRFRLLKGRSAPKEGTVRVSNLSKLYNINAKSDEEILPEEQREDVENAIEAIEGVDSKENLMNDDKSVVDNEKVLKLLENEFDNIEIDEDKVLNVKEVCGGRLGNVLQDRQEKIQTIFAPKGFFDFRTKSTDGKINYWYPIMILVISMLYYFIQYYSTYIAGVILGFILSFGIFKIDSKFRPSSNFKKDFQHNFKVFSKDILEIQAAKEYAPVIKYEGWLNEYPDVYNPHTYHINHTQAVYLKLQGNLLRISNTTSKVPKRAMWDEAPIKPKFVYHRIYNLLDAKVILLPNGLIKKRHWSKKYPICIILNGDQLKFDDDVIPKELSEDLGQEKLASPTKKSFTFRKKKLATMPQRFSKLSEEQERYEIDSEPSRSNTPSPNSEEIIPEKVLGEVLELDLKELNDPDEEIDSLTDGWSNCTTDESPTETRLYLFSRTDRDKEEWFNRLSFATRMTVDSQEEDSNVQTSSAEPGSPNPILSEKEYAKYMTSVINKKLKDEKVVQKTEDKEPVYDNATWLNALMGRVLFDCMCNPDITQRLKERIQRKLCSIKLPYFIEEVLITELNLGKVPPSFHRITRPVIDEKGLLVDFFFKYEGLIILTLTTKLNLMKLKQPHFHETSTSKSAMFNSDVDDSAESSSDDEMPNVIKNISLDAGGSAGNSKKFIKIVDKLAESKFFQAATDNRYIKKAMEGVSNTDLRLKVEIKALEGDLTVNIPPPPTDRAWLGFRPTPLFLLSAHPVVGERNITFMYVTNWIEKKLLQEFQKWLVIPNMEDFIIPVMTSELPNK